MSFLLLVVSGNNTEKNMEAYDQVIKNTRRWLEEVDKLACEVTQQQLARLETSERVLRHIILQNETDTRNETYESVCITFLDNIVLISGTALISKATDSISQEKSHFPETLKPKHEEIKGYLRKLEGKIGEIDLVINEIDEEVGFFFGKDRLHIQNVQNAFETRSRKKPSSIIWV